MLRSKLKSLDLQKAFQSGSDMSSREDQLVKEVCNQTGFTPTKLLQRSSYWNTNQIGAVHYLGTFNNQPAVLKIQGVKPDVSEIFMIKEFVKQNRSHIIRPPKLFAVIPWKDSNQYEALIMEHVTGKKVLQSGKLQTKESIRKFLSYYQEYRQNSLPVHPWLPYPNRLAMRLKQLFQVSQKAYPNHPYRLSGDYELASAAQKVIVKNYKGISLEFVHGHFSVEDLIYKEDQVILFSNLFWKWKYPFYDAAFGYHWFMYELAKIDGITPAQVERQRNLWLSELFGLPWVRSSPDRFRLAKTALLERATAGLLIDSFLIDLSRPISKYLTDSTRDQLKQLSSELN